MVTPSNKIFSTIFLWWRKCARYGWRTLRAVLLPVCRPPFTKKDEGSSRTQTNVARSDRASIDKPNLWQNRRFVYTVGWGSCVCAQKLARHTKTQYRLYEYYIIATFITIFEQTLNLVLPQTGCLSEY